MRTFLLSLLLFGLGFPADAQDGNKKRRKGDGEKQKYLIFKALDQDGDRVISTTELNNAATLLAKLDTNSDGQLDRGELSGGESGSGKAAGGRTPWILVHAKELDANGDGIVEFEAEMMAETNAVFAVYDRNGDQKITPDESGAKGGMPKSALGGFVRQHAAELDRDGDGGISKTEMTSQFAKFFGQADKNGDQKLTPEEYKVEGGVTARFPERMKSKGDRRPPPNEENAGDDAESHLVEKPNFIVFLIDDMGWNAMGFAGNDWIETPRTDAMARSGMIFTNAYSSAPNCAPTRACLMSGQYPPRHGVYTVVDDRHKPGMPHHKILAATSNAELATESVTIAEAMKAGGYSTGMFGMWNLGRGRAGPTTPIGQGFEVFKQPRDLGFEKDRYFNSKREYLTDAFTTEGIDWIEKNREKPFFLYLAYHGVHAPFEAKPDLLEKYRNKPGGSGGRDEAAYAATVEAVDQNVGRVVDALERFNLSDETIVIFHSDNGGTRHYIGPLAGGKGTLYEGGLRVPTAIWGPGIQKGKTATPMLSMDIYPTMLDFAGLQTHDAHPLDGVSLKPVLTGSGSIARDKLFWHFPCYIGGGGPSSAMRKGDYKMLEFFESKSVEVYHLAEDPNETNNLAETNPALTRELLANLHTWQESTNAPRPGAQNPNYDPNAPRKRGREQREKKNIRRDRKPAIRE